MADEMHMHGSFLMRRCSACLHFRCEDSGVHVVRQGVDGVHKFTIWCSLPCGRRTLSSLRWSQPRGNDARNVNAGSVRLQSEMSLCKGGPRTSARDKQLHDFSRVHACACWFQWRFRSAIADVVMWHGWVACL